MVRSKGLCLNCLRPNHVAANCTGRKCKKCDKKHNTVLHIDPIQEIQGAVNHLGYQINVNQVILSTCVINIDDLWGNLHKARVLLDSGSQINLIRTEFAKQLGLPRQATNLPIAGISKASICSKYRISATIRSRTSGFQTDIKLFTLDDITSSMPINTFHRDLIDIPKNIVLADELYNVSREVDMLIGADTFYRLLSVGQIHKNDGNIILQKTVFGWIVSGVVPQAIQKPACNIISLSKLERSVNKFWELEQGISTKNQTLKEDACSKHFTENYLRNAQGQFIVSLPWKEDPAVLGDSREQALKRFYSLETKLDRNTELRLQYSDFMKEYLALGHMEEVSNNQLSRPGYYLPHHAVIKEASTTTRLRVVFDASMKTTTGKSLNDLLKVGPVIQEELFSLLCRFRKHEYVLTADVQKMYRQILISESDQDYHRIFWREASRDPLKVFKLKTVTYGTGPASFLATKCLQELAVIHRSQYQVASNIIEKDFYMDDLLTGASSIEELIKIRNDITSILDGAGLKLHKWASNSVQILENLSTAEANIITWDKTDTIKTLGVQWNMQQDYFGYATKKTFFNETYFEANNLV